MLYDLQAFYLLILPELNFVKKRQFVSNGWYTLRLLAFSSCLLVFTTPYCLDADSSSLEHLRDLTFKLESTAMDVSSSYQLWQRKYAASQGPYRSGKSRYLAPEYNSQKIPLSTFLSSRQDLHITWEATQYLQPARQLLSDTL